MDNSSQWIWERAPEPNDIFWENMHVSTLRRVLYSSLSFLLTAALIIACFFIISAVKVGQRKANEENKGKTLDLKNKTKAQALSALSSVILVVINTLLVTVIRKFSLMERHETITKMNVSVAIKLTVARFINSSAVLVAVNKNAKNWFEGGNLVYDASMLMIIMAF